MTPGFEDARHMLTEADVALTKSDFSGAIMRLDKGLAALGDAHHSDDRIDDTGMKLALAQGEANRGNFEVAARVKRGVLAARLALCERR